MNSTCVTIEGGLLAPDFLEAIADAVGQKPSDFGIEGRHTLVDEASSLWSAVSSYWQAFQHRLQRRSSESLTTITREQWVLPLLEALGYQNLTYQQAAANVDGRSYAISHRTGDSDEDLPVHIVAIDQDLGTRPPSGRGVMSPHALLQDYLNRCDHLWGVVTNGETLRLLRDSSYLTRVSYIEFDLRQMLEGERLDEFILLYRLAHRTRLPRTQDDGPKCLLETYHQQGIEQGGRIRDGLRDAVQAAIELLGNGFLRHRGNDALREAIRKGDVTPQSFYQQLLYLIYRLLFLMVAEERNLLSVDGAGSSARVYFTIRRLRDLASQPLSSPERFDDLYLNFRALCFALCREKYAATLALPPLDGELFETARMPELSVAQLDNRTLLQAIARLSYFTPKDEKIMRRVNYGALDVEELGSVYESLLDLQPVIDTEAQVRFAFTQGTERKTTGSYYTRPELVQELIKSALVPVIEDRLASVSPSPERSSAKERGPGGEAAVSEAEEALLSLTVCDPACGSGHFLLAAARRIGLELAKVRTGEEAPAPDAVRGAVRDVITHCIYGVDKNPLAVDLCKVALWIEGHSGGKPLTFLDHRIRCGDSLVGVFDLSVLEEGIPDAAFDPVSGDDRKLASAIKKRNRQERTGQASLPLDVAAEVHGLVEERRELETLHDDTPEEVHRKRAAWERLQRQGGTLWRERMACHLWTAAFFWPLTAPHPRPPDSPSPQVERGPGGEVNSPSPQVERGPGGEVDSPSPQVERGPGGEVPTTATLHRFLQNPDAVDARLRGHVWALAEHNRFFHWPLEFPEIFEQGGFDCVMGNPPFVNVISGGLEEQTKKLMGVRLPELGGTADLAVRFLSHACRVTKAGGWLAVVQPRAMLNARPAEGFRSRPPNGKAPRMLAPLSRPDWFQGAAVFVALVALGPPGRCRVPLDAGDDLSGWREVDTVALNWFAAASDADQRDGVLQGGVPLGEAFVVQASMTTADAYEAVAFVSDDEAGDGQKLVTTGLIDPGECLWGRVPCRYLKHDYQFPRVGIRGGMPNTLVRRLERSRRPKVIVAGLGNRIEAFVDRDGECTGAVSTYTIYDEADDADRLSRLCEHLNSEPVTVRFRADLGANALGGGSITMRKDWLVDLTVPTEVVAGSPPALGGEC